MGYFDIKGFHLLIVKLKKRRRHARVVFGQGTRLHFNSFLVKQHPQN